MLIVEVKKGNIEKALKDLKGKVIKTKQNSVFVSKKRIC
jgi:ribosomal protein S21